MLPGSVRRVAAAAPHTPILSSIGSAASRPAVANIALTCRPLAQRRYSSSKPSRDNDSGDLPVNQSVQPSTVSKNAGAKSSGEKRKRKAKDSSEEQRLPRVPSTQSIPNECKPNPPASHCIPVHHANLCATALALSSFFSLHRPISVTHSLPRIVTEDAFAAIFTQRARAARTSEAMSTIARTVQGLEQPMATLSIESDGNSHGPESASGSHKPDAMNGDRPEVAVSVQVNSMSGSFLPFCPPPLPQPRPATGSGASEGKDSATAASSEEDQLAQTRVYRAVFTIEESTDAQGDLKIVAHSPELIDEAAQQEGGGWAPAAAPEPRTFLERMALRQMRYEDSREQQQHVRDSSILAISVKRQRKLKMKKKKYKKLQKRLRHEKRKLDK